MPSHRRLGVLLAILALIAVPAIALRAACIGKTCSSAPGPVRVPFCPLPSEVKTLIVNGYREGRSPDVLGVGTGPVADTDGVLWPSTAGAPDTRVPIAFTGTPFAAGAQIPDGTGLDQIAPTIADAIGFHRPHPDVRAGTSIPNLSGAGSTTNGAPSPLIVEIAWRGVGTAQLEAGTGSWPYLRSLVQGHGGSGTIDGTAGSLPLDPVTTLTTIGTGGLPSQHGITGSLIRDDDTNSSHVGQVVHAWAKGSPPSVIATLADDLDHAKGGKPLVGLIGTDPSDRGLIGGGWYAGSQPDDLVYGAADPAVAVATLLDEGYGRDDVTDVIGVVLQDSSIKQLDAGSRAIVDEVRTRVPGAGFAIAGTGSAVATRAAVDVSDVVANANQTVSTKQAVVEAAVPGGLFLDQQALGQLGISSNTVVQAMLDEKPDGRTVFADAFPGFAVSFARYC